MQDKSPTFLIFDHNDESYIEMSLYEFITEFNSDEHFSYSKTIVKIGNKIITEYILKEHPLKKHGGIFNV